MKEVPPRYIRSISNLPSFGRLFNSVLENQPTAFYLGGLGIWLIDKKVSSGTCPPPLQRTAWTSSGGASYQSIKISSSSWRPINAFVWPFPFSVISGCCVTWWFIATGASLLFIATDLQPLSCELWMSYQAGSKKWQINRKPEYPHRHRFPFTWIFSKALASGMIVPYSMISNSTKVEGVYE